jgi:drug/metabolite transporter (DMT)-like permease
LLSFSSRLGPRGVRFFAEAGLALAGIIWGANFLFVKWAVEDMPPMYYVGLRFLLAFVVMGVFSVRRLRALSRREWAVSALVGVLLFAGFYFQTIGLMSTSPGISGFLTCLYVVLVPFFLGLFTRRWPSIRVWVGIAVLLGGIGFLTISGHLAFGVGEVLTLIGTIFWALHILAVGYGATRIDVVALTTVQLGVTGLLGLGVSLLTEPFPGLPVGRSVWIILYTAIAGGVLAYWLMVAGQKHTPPTVAGVLMSLEAVFAVVFSILAGYDQPAVKSIIGFALAFTGLVLVQTGSVARLPAREVTADALVGALAPEVQVPEHETS